MYWKKSKKKGKTLKQKVNKLLKMAKPESKFIYTRFVDTCAPAGDVQLVTEIDQGVANAQRVGLNVVLQSIDFNYFIQNTANSQQNARVMLLKANTDYLNPLLVQQVLYNLTGGANPDVISNLNLFYRDRYTVLYDKTHTFGRDYAAGSVTASDNVNHNVSKHIYLNHKIEYLDDQGDHYEKGALIALYIGAATTSIGFNAVIKYTDC